MYKIGDKILISFTKACERLYTVSEVHNSGTFYMMRRVEHERLYKINKCFLEEKKARLVEYYKIKGGTYAKGG